MNRREPDPAGATSELFKYAGETSVAELHKTFEGIFYSGKCPIVWSESLKVNINKEKWDTPQCGKHRGINLRDPGMRIFYKVLDRSLRKLVNIGD